MANPNDPTRHCPSCGHKGTKVKHITLESLLKDEPTKRIGDEQYRFCDSINCETVYFGDGGTTFVKDDLTVRVGVKEHDAPRHVCYCFDHTIEEINKEIEHAGESTVLDDIKGKMKVACWCETTSPKGGCCLGTVSKYIKKAKEEHGMAINTDGIEEVYGDCCAADGSCCNSGEARQRTGMVAVGGSVVAALAASVSFDDGRAMIQFDTNDPPSKEALSQAVSKGGGMRPIPAEWTTEWFSQWVRCG